MNNALGDGALTTVPGHLGGGHLRLPGLLGGCGTARIVGELPTHSRDFIHSRAAPPSWLPAG